MESSGIITIPLSSFHWNLNIFRLPSGVLVDYLDWITISNAYLYKKR